MKFFSIYGNCQSMVLASFLNNNPDFRKKFQYIPLTPCNQIMETEVDDFIANHVKKLDLFIYIPVNDDYRDNFKFSSNFYLSHLRHDCVKIAFPSLYYNVYDRQMTYLSDEQGNRVHVPHDYHDKILIKMFMQYRHQKNEEIYQKYLEFINNDQNFSRSELEKAARSNFNELKRRENLLETDKRTSYVLKVADFINENYQGRRLFYTLNHPGKQVYLHLRSQLFGYLGIDDTAGDIDPDLDPHRDFIFGIFPPVKKFLGLRFEDNTPYPSNTIGYNKYLEFYRSFDAENLAAIGIYPECGKFTFENGWSEDEITHRWAISKSAVISVISDQAGPSQYKLFFTLFAIRPQVISCLLNDNYLKTIDFTGDQKSAFVCMNVQLGQGENVFRIVSDSDPVSPGTGDLRTLSFAISQFSVVDERNFHS